MTRATTDLVSRFVRALGRPVATPEWVSADGRNLERAKFRVWRFGCPICQAELDDPDRIHRPLSIDSDGRVGCNACYASPQEICREIGRLLAVVQILDSLPVAA